MKEFRIACAFALLVLALSCGVVHAQVPQCPWPNVKKLPVKATVVALAKGFREQRMILWTWEKPDGKGFVDCSFVFKDSDGYQWLAAIADGTFDPAIATANCQAQCTLQYEDNLVAAMHKAQAPYQARAAVSKLTGKTSRPVYNIKPDGTLGEEMDMVRVAIDAPCWPQRRIPGTNYYSVHGQPNVFTPFPDDKIGTGYAQCTVTLPLGAN